MYPRIIYKFLPWCPLSIGLCVIVRVEDALGNRDTKSTEFFGVVEILFNFSIVNNPELPIVIFFVLMLMVGILLVVAFIVAGCIGDELHAGNILP